MNPVLANRIIFVLSLAGIVVAGYLTYTHLYHLPVGCGASSGCDKVATHYTAKGFGIPVLEAIPTAAFGLIMYVAFAGLAFIRAAFESPSLNHKAGSLQWLLATMGVAIAGWLTYLEAAVIHAWCRWCVASAIITLLIFITATAERLTVPPSPQGEIA
jgi:uncharacterized membrane protein